jgi:hypothetical protein
LNLPMHPSPGARLPDIILMYFVCATPFDIAIRLLPADTHRSVRSLVPSIPSEANRRISVCCPSIASAPILVNLVCATPFDIAITVSLFRFGDKRRAGECRHVGAGNHGCWRSQAGDGAHNLGGPGAREVEDAQEEDRRAGTTRVAGTAGCAGLEAGRQWAPVRRMATDRCSRAQGRAAVYAGSARL